MEHKNEGISPWYFTLGPQQKNSLCINFCRENDYNYFQNPSINELLQSPKPNFIHAPLEFLTEMEKVNKEVYVICFGTLNDPKEIQVREEYRIVGYCIDVPHLTDSSLLKNMHPNLVFIYGPILEQNSAICKALSHNISYEYAPLPSNINCLLQNNWWRTKNYVIDGFFTDLSQLKILQEYFNFHVVHLQYRREDLPAFGSFFDVEQDLMIEVSQWGSDKYIGVDGMRDYDPILRDICEKLCPELRYVHYGEDKERYKKYVEDYVRETDSILLSIYDIQHIRKRKNLSLGSSPEEKIGLLSSILYKGPATKNILLSDYPHTPILFKVFEERNRPITEFIDMSESQLHQDSDYSDVYTTQMYYLERQNRICFCEDLKLGEQLGRKWEYWIVGGTGTCGKSSVVGYICGEFGFERIGIEEMIFQIKEGGDDGEDAEVPIEKIMNAVLKIFVSNPQKVFIFDTLPFTGKSLEVWLQTLGVPKIINLKCDAKEIVMRSRKKAEGDLSSDIEESELELANESVKKNQEWINEISGLNSSISIYSVDYNQAQILCETHINSILKLRIFLVQKNHSYLYHNIAIKYGLGLVNLDRVSLRNCVAGVRKCGKRDVIVCNYEGSESSVVSEDLYWIEKNLGEIRYLGMWNDEVNQINEKLMKLERPPQPIKPKPTEGEEEQEEEPVEEEDEDGKPKKVFDIYEHEWSEPTGHKNLSQWYFKLKKNIVERKNSILECYKKFNEVLNILNNEKGTNFYEFIIQK